MKKLLVFLLLLLCAAPAYAVTGRVLYIICDKNVSYPQTNAFQVNNEIARVQEVQGWTYETCMMSDSNFAKTLWPAGYVFSTGDTASGSRYGRYDMAVMLNMPQLVAVRTDAGCISNGMPHFGDWVDRNSARAFPIHLFVPLLENLEIAADTTRNNLWKGVTGAITTQTNGVTLGYPYKNGQGDSLYISTNSGQRDALVIMPDSAGFDWVHPLVWRSTDARDETNTRYATCWMTVGSDDHRVIWLPIAQYDTQAFIFPIIFSMFTKCRPIEMPIIAYGGRTELASIYSGADTTGYGDGVKAVKDYAVANGCKVEFSWYPYYAYSDGVEANYETLRSYATAYPDNIRITMDSDFSWRAASAYASMLGNSTGAATSYDVKILRTKATQDSCTAYFSEIPTTRFSLVTNGQFSNLTTYNTADSTLMVLADRGITDVYNFWNPQQATQAYPGQATQHVVGPQRTWIHDKELRLHAFNYLARYALQGASNHADSLKKAYLDFTNQKAQRALFASYHIPYSLGFYASTDGANYRISTALAKGTRAMNYAMFAAGIALPSLTFSGGSSAIGIGAVQQAAIDATRSIFLDVMKMLNAEKRMGDYIVSTYGVTGQSPYVWAWLSDVKWDRKNGLAFPNSHVMMR